MNRIKIKALPVMLLITGISFAQGNGNSGSTPADTAANANSQSSLRWKLNGNQIQGAEFIGTTNQKDLIFKSNNLVGLTITPTKDFKIPGQIYLEKHKPTFPGEKRFLTVDYYGKVESMKTSGLLDAIYSSPCKEGTTSGTYTPIWASTTGILWTGDACSHARVGINTNIPNAELDVRGQSYMSGNVGIGTSPTPNSLLSITQSNPYNDGINILFDPANTNNTGVGLRITADNDLRKAIVVRSEDPNTNSDAFYVYGNGYIVGKALRLTLDGWSDFVFEDNYKLMPLDSLEAFINANNHLPEIPTEEEVKEDGINVGDTEALLLQKIEELTLYIISLNKKVAVLEEEITTLKK